jgi:hypothetical protein
MRQPTHGSGIVAADRGRREQPRMQIVGSRPPCPWERMLPGIHGCNLLRARRAVRQTALRKRRMTACRAPGPTGRARRLGPAEGRGEGDFGTAHEKQIGNEEQRPL